MNRRDLLIAFAAAAIAPQAARAQSKKPVVIGWLHPGSRKAEEQFLAAFRDGMAALGWREGSNYVLEERWAEGRAELLPALAEELAARAPALIVAAPLMPVGIAAKAAPKTPIVIATGSDPVAAGFAASLARPGGLITGVTDVLVNVTEKYLELLLAAAPKLKRVGFLGDAVAQGRALVKDAAQRSAAQYSVEASFAEIATMDDIEPAVLRLAKEGAQALVLISSGRLLAERRRIVKLALAQRWPVVGGARDFAEAGALLSYGADRSANFRRAAYYVDRILKGAKPGDFHRAAHQIRAGGEPEDREGAGPDHSAAVSHARGQGDRVTTRRQLLIAFGVAACASDLLRAQAPAKVRRIGST